MIPLPTVDLPPDTQRALTELQRLVDAQPTYESPIEEGKRLYTASRRNVVFRPVLTALRAMSSDARRCHYCEDSAATDIEHVMAKEYYPDLVFAWTNYLYGCSRCNRSKSSICEIYCHADGRRVSVPQMVREAGGPPESGDPVLINPRYDDPMEFMTLDLRFTFFFRPRGNQGTREWERARHTIDVLKLNEEDVLPQARREAYENYVARLEKYIARKSSGADQETLTPIIISLRKMGHPTVWHEMKRQHTRIEILTELFERAPEALKW